MASRGIPDCECPNFPWGDLIAPAIFRYAMPRKIWWWAEPTTHKVVLWGGALRLPPGARADVQSAPSGKGLLLFPTNPLPEPLPSSIPSRSGEPPGGTTTFLLLHQPKRELLLPCRVLRQHATIECDARAERPRSVSTGTHPRPCPSRGSRRTCRGPASAACPKRELPCLAECFASTPEASGGLLTEIGLGPWTLGREHD